MVGEFQAKSFKSLVAEYRNGPLWGRTELSDTELDFSGKALYCAIQNWTFSGALNIILIRNSHKKSVPVWRSEGLSVQSPFRILPGLLAPQRQHSRAALL